MLARVDLEKFDSALLCSRRLRTEMLGEKDVEAGVDDSPGFAAEWSDGNKPPSSQEGGASTSKPPTPLPSASRASQDSGSQSWSQDVRMGPQNSDSDAIEDFEDDLLW